MTGTAKEKLSVEKRKKLNANLNTLAALGKGSAQILLVIMAIMYLIVAATAKNGVGKGGALIITLGAMSAIALFLKIKRGEMNKELNVSTKALNEIEKESRKIEDAIDVEAKVRALFTTTSKPLVILGVITAYTNDKKSVENAIEILGPEESETIKILKHARSTHKAANH